MEVRIEKNYAVEGCGGARKVYLVISNYGFKPVPHLW